MSDGFQREGRMINVFVRSFGAQHIIYSHSYRVDSARLLELPFGASRRGIFCASLCERWWLETTFPTRGGLKSTNHWVKSFLHKTGATSPWRRLLTMTSAALSLWFTVRRMKHSQRQRTVWVWSTLWFTLIFHHGYLFGHVAERQSS